MIYAAVSQFMYAGRGLHVTAPAEQIRDSATLMYFGDDLIEIFLTLALLASWGTLPRGVSAPIGTDTQLSTGRGEPLPNPVRG